MTPANPTNSPEPVSPGGHGAGRSCQEPAVGKAPPSNKPIRILLVEDHKDTRDVLVKLLGRRGHRLVAVSSLAEARAAARAEDFDLVISDLGLPDGSGGELMKELRSQFGLKGIALSGYGDASALSQSSKAGCVGHLTKPVSIGVLEEVLARAMGR